MGVYYFLKVIVRYALKVFFRKIHLQYATNIPQNSSILLVANHPNSFMDALLIAAFFPRPLYFLARGDAFHNPFLARIFKVFNMLPVYRMSEGKEHLEKNIDTFASTFSAINKGGAVLIFGEGISFNNWELRSFKKGAARIAQQAWKNNTSNLIIIPIGLTYEHFDGANKSVMLNFGNPITKSDFEPTQLETHFAQSLNAKLVESISTLAYVDYTLLPNSSGHLGMMNTWQQAEKTNTDILTSLNNSAAINSSVTPVKTEFTFRSILRIFLFPHHKLMSIFSKILTSGNVFYDSITFVLTLILFPLYVLTLMVIGWLLF